jgi:hypothetical protein
MKKSELIKKLQNEYNKEYATRGLSGKLEEIDKRLKAAKNK